MIPKELEKKNDKGNEVFKYIHPRQNCICQSPDMSAKITNSEKFGGEGGEGRRKKKRKSKITSKQKMCERQKKKFLKDSKGREKKEINRKKNKQQKIGEKRRAKVKEKGTTK